jgi:hypothetical protein
MWISSRFWRREYYHAERSADRGSLMALSRRQLMAIFAKMAQRKKAAGLPRAQGTGDLRIKEIALKRPEMPVGLKDEDIPKLLKRVPQSHRRLSEMRDFRVHNSRKSLAAAWSKSSPVSPGNSMVGYYDHFQGKLHVRGDVSPYVGPVGYSPRPSHIPMGSQWNTGRFMQRNAKVGSSKAFYHEYGHSINNMGKLSRTREWMNIGTKDWRGVDPKEAWSESYALYATSKVSRSRLRRERPDAYKYMKEFFARED